MKQISAVKLNITSRNWNNRTICTMQTNLALASVAKLLEHGLPTHWRIVWSLFLGLFLDYRSDSQHGLGTCGRQTIDVSLTLLFLSFCLSTPPLPSTLSKNQCKSTLRYRLTKQNKNNNNKTKCTLAITEWIIIHIISKFNPYQLYLINYIFGKFYKCNLLLFLIAF